MKDFNNIVISLLQLQRIIQSVIVYYKFTSSCFHLLSSFVSQCLTQLTQICCSYFLLNYSINVLQSLDSCNLMLLFMISCTMTKISVVKSCLACHLITSDIVQRESYTFLCLLAFFFFFASTLKHIFFVYL